MMAGRPKRRARLLREAAARGESPQPRQAEVSQPVEARPAPKPIPSFGQRELASALKNTRELRRQKRALELRGEAKTLNKQIGELRNPSLKRLARKPVPFSNTAANFRAVSLELSGSSYTPSYARDEAEGLGKGLLLAGLVGVGLLGLQALLSKPPVES
jgi:hypothetical protein